MRKPRDDAVDTPAPRRRSASASTTAKSRGETPEVPWARVVLDADPTDDAGAEDEETDWTTSLHPAVAATRRRRTSADIRGYHDLDDEDDDDEAAETTNVDYLPIGRRKSTYNARTRIAEEGRRHSMAT
jgi:hypothetical protein